VICAVFPIHQYNSVCQNIDIYHLSFRTIKSRALPAASQQGARACFELQKNDPKPLKMRRRAQNRTRRAAPR
jgi:hypothetical protein